MNPGFLRQYPGLITISFLSSLTLSVWCVWADPIINNDGVYYLRAAAEISAGNWAKALSIYSWPIYSTFIAYLAKVPGLDLTSAAYVLNALFAAILVVGFLRAVHELGGDRNTLIIAALLILAFPTLNKYRSFVIRDIGYLAFHLWSLCYLFSYWKEKRGRPLLGWFVCAFAACLFRVEGVAILASVPVVLLALRRSGTRGDRWVLLGAAAVVGLLLAVLLGLWLIKDIALINAAGQTATPGYFLQAINDYVAAAVGGKLELLKDKFAGRYYMIVYVLIIVFVAVAEIVRRLALIYAVLPAWGLKKGILFPEMELRPIWLAMILINTLILIGSAFFISIVVDRYTLTIAVTVLMGSPFVFVHLWKHWGEAGQGARQKWALPVLMVAAVLLGVNGLNVFTDKRYLAEAGLWIRDHTPGEATLHSNNLILIHYSGKDAFHSDDNYSWRHTYSMIKGKQWEKFDYIAIELADHDYPWLEWLEIHLQGPPMRRISGEHGSSVFIYRNPERG
ncbi:hypothetical protein ACFL1S_04245 [Pseudomonadota bacterium]